MVTTVGVFISKLNYPLSFIFSDQIFHKVIICCPEEARLLTTVFNLKFSD